MDKRAILEERQRKWMGERRQNISKDSQIAVKPDSLDMVKGASTKQSTSNMMSAHEQSEEFISKLTDKLSKNIRQEVQRELSLSTHSADVRDVLSEKMESYLQAELGTHKCQICFQLMTSPHHTPMLLCPCGHTFCKTCIDNFSRRSSSPACPYCKSVVQSVAVNRSLEDLISQFAKQKSMVQSKQSHLLDEIFETRQDSDTGSSYRSSAGGGSRGGVGSSVASSSGAGLDEGNRAHYAAQYRNCEIRHSILCNEREEYAGEGAALDRRRDKLFKASSHLSSERALIEEKIQQLMEERDLIDKHLTDQQVKLQQVEGQAAEVTEKIETLDDTIGKLKFEMEKLQLLAGQVPGGAPGGRSR